MNNIRRGYYFILSPFIMIAAIVLFILDSMNVNVAQVASYILKETKEM
jgi:surface polysaccharide O-acyltransferase-like enzyme